MGKIYYSPFSGFQFIIRPRRDIFDGGVKVDEIRELVAEFAVHRGEYTYLDKDGNQQVAPDISGHYFDLDSYAEMKEWTKEEKSLSEIRLDNLCKTFPDQISLHTAPAALLPWPTYEETPFGKISELAIALGLTHEALAYEKERTSPRKSVIGELETAIEADQTEAVEELAAV